MSEIEIKKIDILNKKREGESEFMVKIPRSIPLGILITIFLQIAAVVWGVSSFYKENEIMKENITSQFTSLQEEIRSLKGTIYTRQEAAILSSSLDKLEERVTFLERLKLEGDEHDKTKQKK